MGMTDAPLMRIDLEPDTGTPTVPCIGPVRQIGDILREQLSLDERQVRDIVAKSHATNMRFGEAAVSLGLASTEAVLIALAEQFQYPYAPKDRHKSCAELVMLSQPFSPQAEAIRGIRSQVMRYVFRHNERHRALAIVSPDSADGKTFLAANLAVSLAQMGGRTLIVDADLRGPRLHRLLQVDNRTGLSSVLTGRADAHSVQPVPGVPGLFVMPGGTAPPNPLELIERAAFGNLILRLSASFDHVLVDTPAAAYGADAQAIADRCGATLLVVRKDSSRLGALRALIGSLTDSPSGLVGVVQNDF
jgi:protein-tyrosine kinase